MKKIKKNFLIVLFFLFTSFLCIMNLSNNYIKFSYAKIYKNDKNQSIINKNYIFTYLNKKYTFNSNELINDIILTDNQKIFLRNEELYNVYFDKISKFGLSKREIVNYFCPEIEKIKMIICDYIDVKPEENYVQVEKNSCKLNYVFGKEGIYLDQDYFYDCLYENLKQRNNRIVLELKVKKYADINDIKNDFQEKSSFLTNFNTSSESRKNNIKVALRKFDGLVLEQGEILSFNTVTGIRNQESGYMPAKIISNGTFVEGFGGGVCQVSTTLYNACLLAGLEILEVHNHSLPVSYVEPSFDAMVNSGSSDLVVRNNTDGKIIITTSSKNDYCKIKIFGKKNKYKITRYSEKTKIIPAENDFIDTDMDKYGDIDLEIGEEKRISYPKDGFYSNGYLKYFDTKGTLIETKKIRENKYNPTKGIIIKRNE